MNVNEMGREILGAYQRQDEWAGMVMQDHLLKLMELVSEAGTSFRMTRKFDLPLIHSTCAVSPVDCDFFAECQAEGAPPEPCSPEGLAFRFADIILYTLAVMQELGLDIDAVVTAEFKYHMEEQPWI